MLQSIISRHWRLFTLLCSILLGISLALPGLQGTPVHADSTLTYTVGPAIPQTQLSGIDLTPVIYKDNGGNLWMIQPTSNNAWKRYEAPASNANMDHLVQQSDAQLPGNFTHSSCNDDGYWIDSGWYDSSTGTLYGTIHIEYCYRGTKSGYKHIRRIGLAQSSDNGATWTYDGDIVTPNSTLPPGASYTYGDGDQHLLVDTHSGYFYLFYWSFYEDANSNPIQFETHAARCPISSTQNGMHMYPGCWQKYLNGSWSEPGLGGQESGIPGLQSWTVVWDSYLNKYLSILQQGGMATATDLNSEDWSSYDGTKMGSEWYQWGVDDSTQDTNTLGQHFRLYIASNEVIGPTMYREITLGGSTTTIALDRYYNSSTASHWVTTNSITAGYNLELTPGYLYTTQQSGTQTLYGCQAGSNNYFVSLQANCEGGTVLQTEGYLYPTQPSGVSTVALYRCVWNGGHWVSTDPNCEGGGTNEELLGYALQSGSGSANLVQNPGFETGDLTGWNVWVPSGQSTSNAFVEPGGHSGNYRLAEYHTSNFQVAVYQAFTNIPNGTYLASAWVDGSGSQQVEVRDQPGGNILAQASTAPADYGTNWHQISFTVNVTGGRADIELDVTANAYDYLRVDDVVFAHQ